MAQLVEQRPYKAKVGSSSLSGSTPEMPLVCPSVPAMVLSGLFLLATERGATEVVRSTLPYGALLALSRVWERWPARACDSSRASSAPITP